MESMELQEGYLSAPDDIPQRMTGAIPTPRHLLAAATPHIAVGATPPRWWWIPQKLSMWLNDQEGDCVSAEEAFAKACSGVFITDQVLDGWVNARRLANGAMLDDVLDKMATDGFHQDENIYGDGARLSVNYADDSVLRNAISKGPVKIGVASRQLQRVAGRRNGWFLVGAEHDHNEDHCVSLSGYGMIAELAKALSVTVPAGVDGSQPGYHLFTWGTIGIIDVPSMVAITGEAWLRTPTTITHGTGAPNQDVVTTPRLPPTIPSTLRQLVDGVLGFFAHMPFPFGEAATWLKNWFDAHVVPAEAVTSPFGGFATTLIDEMFVAAEKHFADRPVLLAALKTINTVLDAWLMTLP